MSVAIDIKTLSKEELLEVIEQQQKHMGLLSKARNNIVEIHNNLRNSLRESVGEFDFCEIINICDKFLSDEDLKEAAHLENKREAMNKIYKNLIP